MPALKIFRRNKSTRIEQNAVGGKEQQNPIFQQDILLSIARFLDTTSLFELRLVCRTINNTIKANESWICNGIAKTEYHWVFESADKAFRDPSNAPAHLSRFPTFKSLVRLHLATLLPLLLLWNQFTDHAAEDTSVVLPGLRVSAACVRGFLTLWKLADIEHEIEGTPSAWLPREEYFAFAEVASSYVYPFSTRPAGKVGDFSPPHHDQGSLRMFRLMLESIETIVHNRRQRRRGSQGTSVEQATERYNRSRKERLDLVAQLDQGAWLDLHIVTTLVLAFYISYSDSASRKNSPTTASKLALSEWALRQGPDLILGILSVNSKRRRWMHQWIDTQWGARHERIQALDGTWTNVGPHGPLGISTTTSGRYPHPRCAEWELQGWPTLVECTKVLLFREWRTYTLKDDEPLRQLAEALAQRTGDISFQTRMQGRQH